MQTYPIPTEMYKGAGEAIAAIRDGKLVALKMLDDYAEPSKEEVGYQRLTNGAMSALRFERNRRKAQHQIDCAKDLASAGEVLIGVASGYEFCAIRAAE